MSPTAPLSLPNSAPRRGLDVTERNQILIEQDSHGFSVGHVPARVGGTWVLCDGTNAAHRAAGIIIAVTTHSFLLALPGSYVDALAVLPGGVTLVDGTVYGIDTANPGRLAAPGSPTHPVLQALSTHSAIMLPTSLVAAGSAVAHTIEVAFSECNTGFSVGNSVAMLGNHKWDLSTPTVPVSITTGPIMAVGNVLAVLADGYRIQVGGYTSGGVTYAGRSSAWKSSISRSMDFAASLSGGKLYQQLPLMSGFQRMVQITSGSSWTVPPGVYRIFVQMIGGGGGGGGRTGTGTTDWISSTQFGSNNLPREWRGLGSGGNAGELWQAVVSVYPGWAMPLSIGSGGAAGTTGNGQTGGHTWIIDSGSTGLIAQGGIRGIGGFGSSPGQAPTSAAGTPPNIIDNDYISAWQVGAHRGHPGAVDCLGQEEGASGGSGLCDGDTARYGEGGKGCTWFGNDATPGRQGTIIIAW
jgi:hypothetical protein